MASISQVKVERLSAVFRMRFVPRLKWIEDVPDEVAVCEFRCRRERCCEFNWQLCEKRLAGC